MRSVTLLPQAAARRGVPFTADDVRRLARAQRLRVDDAEAAALARDLDRILDAFGSLPAAEGEPVADAAPPRADEPRPGDPDVLAAAPRREHGFVKLPRRSA